MQKDIRTDLKGETSSTKEGDKLRQVGHDVNASLKENVGVGVGNYSSEVDREKSRMHEKSYDLKKEREESPKQTTSFKDQLRQGKEDLKQSDFNKEEFNREGERKDESDVTGAVTHKVKEIGREINASLKQNVGIGVGNYSSEKDREIASFHKEKYDEKIEDTKQMIEEKKEEAKEKINEGETGKFSHRAQQIGHDVNAVLKENIGIGIGDYPSEVDRERSKEHWEGFQQKVKEEQKPEVGDSTTIGHKIREVVHNINANLKEVIGVGFGNYSSEVDRELAHIHKEEYEKKVEDYKPESDLKSDLKEKKSDIKSDLKEKKSDLKSGLNDDKFKQQPGKFETKTKESGENKL